MAVARSNFTALDHFWKNWRMVFPRCHYAGCASGQAGWRRLLRRHMGVRLRDAWYCTPQCFEMAARQIFTRMANAIDRQNSVTHRIPLALLMLSRGQLTQEQLLSALRAQRSAGRYKIGYWLEELGFATEQQVTSALALQWGCPVFALSAEAEPSCARMLPVCMMEFFQMMPVHYVKGMRVLYVGFCEKIEYTVLYAIEQMLDCRTQPCLVGRRALKSVLERIRLKPHPSELVFERLADAAEMARITRSYVLKLGAEAVRAVACGVYVWLRLEAGQNSMSLLFRALATEGTQSSEIREESPIRG